MTKKQFSLRSLLIAVTAVAVALGVYASRWHSDAEAGRKLLSLQNQTNAVHVFFGESDWLAKFMGLGGPVTQVYLEGVKLPAADDSLSILGQCKALKTLWLFHCQLSYSQISALPLLSSVEELHLVRLEGALGAREVSCLIKKLPNLRSLSVKCCSQLDDSALKHLPKSIQGLSIDVCKRVTGEFLVGLEAPELRELTLTRVPLNAAAMQAICERVVLEKVALQARQHIDFDWTRLSQLTRVKNLYLWRQGGASEDITELQTRMPHARVIGE